MQEEVARLRSAAAAPAGPVDGTVAAPAEYAARHNTQPKPFSLSFESGFGSLEQHMLAEDVAQCVDRVSRMMLDAGVVIPYEVLEQILVVLILVVGLQQDLTVVPAIVGKA